MFVEEKEVGEAPVKVEKLSCYIRIGAALRPQAYTRLFVKGGSCALGAAFEAMGLPYMERADFTYPNETLWTRMREMIPDSLFDEVWRRNDMAGWTRERIADWLETQGY